MYGLWKSWMLVWCFATLGLGVVLALAAFPGVDAPARLYYDLIYWPLDGRSAFGEQTRFTAGVLGAVLIGWGLTILVLIDAAQKAGAGIAVGLWRGLTSAMAAWFLIDCAISIASGAPVNAVANTVFLATYLIPVLASGVMGASAKAAQAR